MRSKVLDAQNKALAGTAQFSYTWQGAQWQFVSEENLKIFQTAPEKYAPQFGGYCAFAVGKGFTANISPEAFHMTDGKLYLFADTGIRDKWLAGGKERVSESHRNWR